jgi:hypothetical protein
MHSFKDTKDRTWLLEINVAAAKKVRALTGVDLYRLVENDFAKLQELLRDPITLIDVIYVLCQEQAEKLGMNDEAFGGSFAGETVSAAADAFVEAFISFSQDRRAAAVLRSMKTKGTAAVEILATKAEQRLEFVTPEMLADDIENPGSLGQKLKAKFGNSLAPSGSTPAP